MNAQFLATLTAAAATTVAIASASAPAQAFQFGANGLQFDTDTTVNFTFVESHGSYQSALKIFEAGNLGNAVASLFNEVKQSDDQWNNEWKGTFGNAVASSTGKQTVAFTFKGGVNYVLGLLSGENGTVYSTSGLNSGSQQAVFASPSTLLAILNKESTNAFKENPNGFASGNPFTSPGGVMIAFDDRGNGNDTDFQDFIVQAEAVPEPLTMGGIALAGAGLAYARRQRQRA
ncbi:PEP-CTERM sorting domain-containing protein [Leptolyngbya sp. FACHB-36]|uniref:PEP-CTERM sorting domain-containing protein n=1 Tax=Leptolyngbya sp. FACHB-36 TaxID=2692808 RepID=UPI001680F95A|nr:PEP-CTERM sorting domain-containing protein [Leptolyngbya sp. FACHB-36]MBD2022076.1 PEP-CTERM sorting domain-containing protein [Leptolyngbya sp. FACHB-36]